MGRRILAEEIIILSRKAFSADVVWDLDHGGRLSRLGIWWGRGLRSGIHPRGRLSAREAKRRRTNKENQNAQRNRKQALRSWVSLSRTLAMKDENATEKTPPPLDEDDIALLKTYVSFLFCSCLFSKSSSSSSSHVAFAARKLCFETHLSLCYYIIFLKFDFRFLLSCWKNFGFVPHFCVKFCVVCILSRFRRQECVCKQRL